MIYIVDIDVTIADNTHRQSVLERVCKMCLAPFGRLATSCHLCGSHEHKVPQRCWDTFCTPDLMRADTPVLDAQRCLREAQAAGVQVHFLTGRGEATREVTEEWLTQHYGFVRGKHKLVMRGTAMSGLPASEYKERAFKLLRKELGTDQHYVFFDDDLFVLSMYSKYGLALRSPAAWNIVQYKRPGRVEEAWSL